jgi:hypothetical protein
LSKIFLAKLNHSPIFPGFFISLNDFIDCTLQTFQFCHKIGKINQGLESQTPPYLPNGDILEEFYCTIGFRTLENEGVGHLKTPKKKPNFGGDTHVTLNLKP